MPFADANRHQARNVDPNNYTEAINWLLKSGLKVVRIGNSAMSQLPSCPGLIDLTQYKPPGEVDIYLCGAAKFYFGSSSGPYSAAYNFGIPSALTAALLYGNGRPNTFKQCLRLKNTKTQQIMNFSEIEELGLNSCESSIVLEKNNLEPIFPDNDENLNFVKEMVEYLEKGSIYEINQKRANEKLKRGHTGGLCSRSLNLL